MAATGGSIGVLSCPSSYFKPKARPTPPPSSSFKFFVNNRRKMCCLAVQEPSTSTVGEVKKAEKEEGAAAEKPKPRARVSAAKAPAKPLPQLMEEDVIPSLETTLQAQQHISDLQISFDGNKLEGSFLNEGVPHSFWAFFADGTITGPKGFSLSSYGSEVSTVEPFLVDEKRPTAKHVVFWVEKRLAAQGIIPVWRD